MPKFIKFFMTHRRLRVLLFYLSGSPKVYSMNLFGMWEVGAPKVGAPSSHVMSLGLLFIGNASNGFLLIFLDKIREKGCGKYKKKFGKISRKKKRKI